MAYTYTPKQINVLDYIREFVEAHRYAPTLEEMAGHFRISKISVLQHLRALQKRGAIHRERYATRGIEIRDPDFKPSVRPRPIADPAARPRHRRSGVSDPIPMSAMAGLRFRHAGYIAAGRPIEAVEQQETLDVSNLLSRKRECFILQVRGDSMIEDHILDGDYVVIEARHEAEDGETVVALLDSGEATLKRFYHANGNGKVRLEAANPRFATMELDPGALTIQGVVVGVLRRY